MKTNCRKGHLTFGEFIMAVYDACGRQKAEGIVRLAVKARLVEFRGHDRIVILEPGPGKNFFIPMNKPLNIRGAKAAAAPTPGATHRPQRILVVDDDPGIRQLGTEVLIRHGYQVDAAEDHTAGWKALQVYTYDLLITDLDMPRLSGLKLVKRLRDARLALPVILASGIMTPQELSRNPWFHLSGALLKPVSPDQLLQTVQAVLRAPDSAREQIAPPPSHQPVVCGCDDSSQPLSGRHGTFAAS
jgi:CheY-like chemotaxis protein